MSNILTTDKLNFDTESRSLLYNVDLSIESGQIISLLGMSGDGKEKLLDIIAGYSAPESGSMQSDDKAYNPQSISYALKSGVLFISENPTLAPDLTITESITLGLKISVKNSDIVLALKKVGLDHFSLNTLCKSLTSSESRLLLLARAILAKGKLYLFNNVDSAFSKQERKIYFSIIRELKGNGATVIFIPSLVEELQFIDRYIAIKNGELTECTGTVSEFIDSIYQDNNESVFPVSEPTRSNSIVMESIGLKGMILRDASINIRESEVCGLFGLKGSGIEELLSILIGKTSSTGGVLSANGSNLQAKKISPVKVHKAGISVFNGTREESLDYDIRTIRLRSFTGNVIVLIDPARGLQASERKNIYSLINELKKQGKAIILYTPSIEELKGVSDSIAIIHNGELSAARSTDNWKDEEIYKYVTSGKLEAFSIL